MVTGPRTENDPDQFKLVVAALAGCLGNILSKADPAFRPEILASIDQMLSQLRTSGAATEETLNAVARFRQLVG